MSKRLSFQHDLIQSSRNDFSSRPSTDYITNFVPSTYSRIQKKHSINDKYQDSGTTFETSKYNSKINDFSGIKKLPDEIANMRETFNYSSRTRPVFDQFQPVKRESNTYNKLSDMLRQTVDLRDIKKNINTGQKNRQFFLDRMQKSETNSVRFNQAYIKSQKNIDDFGNRYGHQTFSAGRKQKTYETRQQKAHYLNQSQYEMLDKKSINLSNAQDQIKRMKQARQTNFQNIPITQPLSFRKSTIGSMGYEDRDKFSKKNYTQFYTPKIEKSTYDERFDGNAFNKKNNIPIIDDFSFSKEMSSPIKTIQSIVSDRTSSTNYLQKSKSYKNIKVKFDRFNQKTSIDDFILGKNLGQGKFGVVQMVQHKATGAIFAMKKVKKDFIKSNQMVDQFALQIKLQYCIVHPFILKIYGIFDDEVHVYLILELMQQGNLYNYLKKHKKLPQADIAQKIKYLSQSIQHIHEQGIAHRDIKPENIMLSNDVCKLADFGWATFCDQRRKTYCGTCDYVAPQILQGSQYDMSVDLWCIGVLTYQLVTGKPPFYHSNQKQTMKRIKQVNLTYPQTISHNLADFIENLIKKKPQERMSAEEILKHQFLKEVEFV